MGPSDDSGATLSAATSNLSGLGEVQNARWITPRPVMSIEVEIQKRGACPQCGAKLPDVPVSLCPYCASPLETRADREARTSVHTARIGRIREHRDFPVAVEWTPPEGLQFHQGRRRVWWGQRGLIASGLLAGIVLAQSGGDALRSPLFWAGAVGLGAFGWLWAHGRSLAAAALQAPLLKRAALILDRRSETKIRGWSGDTTYFFRLEFEDGAQGEFAFPGLGPQDDPYSNNLPGVAYTRGQTLLHFRHVRV